VVELTGHVAVEGVVDREVAGRTERRPRFYALLGEESSDTSRWQSHSKLENRKVVIG